MAYKPHSMPELLKPTEWSDPSGLRRVLANVAAEGDERQIMRNLWRDDIPTEDIDADRGPMGVRDVTPSYNVTVVGGEVDTGSHATWDSKPWGTGITGPAADGPTIRRLRGRS